MKGDGNGIPAFDLQPRKELEKRTPADFKALSSRSV
jgi:hypothetical protein